MRFCIVRDIEWLLAGKGDDAVNLNTALYYLHTLQPLHVSSQRMTRVYDPMENIHPLLAATAIQAIFLRF